MSINSARGPFVLRQRKRLEPGDPIKLEGHNPRGDRVLYSGVVKAVDVGKVTATIRTEDGFVEVALEIPG